MLKTLTKTLHEELERILQALIGHKAVNPASISPFSLFTRLLNSSVVDDIILSDVYLYIHNEIPRNSRIHEFA